MNTNISNISTKTIENLSKKSEDITPIAYTNEFCKVAKNLKLSIEECQYFEKTLSKISKDEIEASNVSKVETIYDIIDILIQRIPSGSINKVSQLFQDSLQPSISLSIAEDLKSFCIKIGDSPSLIFEETIQQEMEKFIEKRFEVDKKIVAQKTADIARLISLMNKYLGDAIDSNKDGSSTVSNIKHEIKSINITGSTKDELNQLQSKLVEAAITIENEMSSVNKNLQSGKKDVVELERKVIALERELKETKLKSTKDFLTGTLNRRSYESEIKKFENAYIREQKDYAIVFFDIDHFKSVNDTYGHECGDVILKTFAALILKLTRDTDIVGRYGGEEFIVALHHNNKEELNKYISRIKNVITKNKFIHKDNKIKITFSAGVQLRSLHKSTSETITKADALLYKAKETGRNKIIFWDNREL